jgi:dihydropteroate synthase-like protein
MHVLILTGQLAYPHAQEIVETHHIPAKVLALPVSVASFITPELVKKIQSNVTISEFDMILLPGLVPWDASKLEKTLGIRIRKGPQNIDDLPDLFKKAKLDDLSPKSAADALFSKQYDEEYVAFIENQEKKAKETGLPRNFTLPRSHLTIGMDLPPRIMAQVINATRLPDEEVLATARFFLQKGAEIIDIGSDPQGTDPQKLGKLISRIRSDLNVPVAVDSMRPEEIQAGVAAGAEIILSIDLGNLAVLEQLPKDVAVVVIPTNVTAGKFPSDPVDRVKNIHELVAKCKAVGIHRILADPLLGAPIQPGLVKSLEAYSYLHHAGPTGLPPLDVPLLLGAENVFEMVDIDSPGVNGLLAAIAVELQAGIILATEYSPKTQNSIDEFRRGIQLAYRAKMKRSPPKDLGISLLALKSKGKNPLPPETLKNAKTIPLEGGDFTRDPAGYFKIFSSYRTGQVIAAHYSNAHELLGVYAAASGETMCKYLVRQKLVTLLDHAAYLGRELAKAESCAKTGGNYFQVD